MTFSALFQQYLRQVVSAALLAYLRAFARVAEGAGEHGCIVLAALRFTASTPMSIEVLRYLFDAVQQFSSFFRSLQAVREGSYCTNDAAATNCQLELFWSPMSRMRRALRVSTPHANGIDSPSFVCVARKR